MPQLQPEGATNYAAAFELLCGAIPHDLDWFKSHGARLYRPAVFFITDGRPTSDGWRPWREQLVAPDFKYRPNIVSFGFGAADEPTISEIATFKAYVAKTGEKPATVLRTIANELTQSILASSQSAAGGKAILTMPETIKGMNEITVDMV